MRRPVLRLLADAPALAALLAIGLVFLFCPGCASSAAGLAGEAAAWVGGLFLIACAAAIWGARRAA